MEFIETEMPGLWMIRPKVFQDARGSFVKTYHHDIFLKNGLDFRPREEFFSVSHAGVIRGMHFQLPPHTQARLLTCLTGKILDVVVDLRRGSPTFGRARSCELSADMCQMLYIPEGFAHGFLGLEPNSLVNYVANQVHSPAHDTGILWTSIPFDWPVRNPIVSERDQKFPPLGKFESPFKFE